MNTQGIPITTIGTGSPLVIVEQNGVTGKAPIKQASKTLTKQAVSLSSLIPDLDKYDLFVITAQAEALTIDNPSVTPVNGDGFILRIKDNGVARAISFGSKFRAFGSALPTITTINKTIYIPIVYNSTDDKFDVFPYHLEQ